MMNGKACPVTKLCWVLVIIGALNWGLIGIFDWNLVNAIFGSVTWLEKLIYILVGLSGICAILSIGKCCKKSDSCCGGGSCKSGGEMEKKA